jgi:hypothetical protein
VACEGRLTKKEENEQDVKYLDIVLGDVTDLRKNKAF